MGLARSFTGWCVLGLLAVSTAVAAASEQVPAAVQECAACHMVYPPQFLPQRSWTALLSKLSDHFGEIATVSEAKKAEIAAYLAANAADGPQTVGGQRFLRGVPSDAAPLRITDMPWWIGAHEEVNFALVETSDIKSAANCLGCHGNK